MAIDEMKRFLRYHGLLFEMQMDIFHHKKTLLFF